MMRSSRRPAALAATVTTLVLLALSPASAAAACEGATRSFDTAGNRTLVRATLCMLNAKRGRHNLRPLRLNSRLSTASRGHSRAMVRHHFFSHDSRDGTSFLERIRRSGYLDGASSWAVGENIAWGSGRLSTPRSIASAWMHSPGHRANILGRTFRAIGIGIANGTPSGDGGATYTTDFGRRG
jgi:uncharacterized protein YkwD